MIIYYGSYLWYGNMVLPMAYMAYMVYIAYINMYGIYIYICIGLHMMIAYIYGIMMIIWCISMALYIHGIIHIMMILMFGPYGKNMMIDGYI